LHTSCQDFKTNLLRLDIPKHLKVRCNSYNGQVTNLTIEYFTKSLK